MSEVARDAAGDLADGAAAPRVTPGSGRAELGWLNALIVRVIGLGSGGRPLHIFTTLARHRGLFRRWLIFAGALMPGGTLARRDTEMLILRTAHNCGCDYEWHQHERIGRAAGLSAEEIARIKEGPQAGQWGDRSRLLLRAADELHRPGELSDATWAGLREFDFSDNDLIELCLLVGHYAMLAKTLNTLRVEPEPPQRPTRLSRLIERVFSL